MGGDDDSVPAEGGEAISKSELKRRQKAEKKAAEKVKGVLITVTNQYKLSKKKVWLFYLKNLKEGGDQRPGGAYVWNFIQSAANLVQLII